MTQTAWWRNNRRIILQLGLFALCCVLAVWIRSIVAADTLSDLASVTLQIGAVFGFIAAAAVALPAGRYARTGTERAALRVVPVAVLIVAGMFVKTSYADVSVALHALTTKSDGSQTDIALGPNGRDVRLSGGIVEGAARRLSDMLAAHPTVERIHLTSDGGLADEGEALRKVIAAHGLTTFVSDYCVSACTLAFLGGRERLVMEGARLGFHAPYEEGLFDQTFAGDSSAERASYLLAGVSADFVTEAFKVKPEDIWTPSVDRLIAAHVATGVVDRYRFPDSNLDGIDTKAGALSTVLSNFALARALQGVKPAAVDIIAAWYLDAYRRGLSEGEIVDEVEAILGQAAAIAMADADDETVIDFGRFITRGMEASDDDAACRSIGGRADLVEAEAQLDQNDATAENQAAALFSRALRTRRPQPVVSDDQNQVEDLPCAQVRDLYRRALRRPPHEAASIIRTFVTPQDLTPVAAQVEGVLSH